MSSEMVISPTSSSVTVDESLTSRDDQSISELSQDDIEAAQTLEDLRRESRKAPSIYHASSITRHDSALVASQGSEQPEPLLSLLTSHHPLLSNAINGSLLAYSSSKDYSRSFKYGAEFVERLGSPVVTTVGTAGRISGVETGVRWWLKRPAGPSHDQRSKRGRVHGDSEIDVEKGYQDPVAHQPVHRSLSVASFETLPAYDDHRSPQYVEVESSQPSNQSNGRTWSSKLVITTSGLGVAMHQESLDCLKYALQMVRWANNHLGRIASNLRDIVEKPEDDQQKRTSKSDMRNDGIGETAPLSGNQTNSDDHDVNGRIKRLSEELFHILKDVSKVISDYAGNCLPENARQVVMRHLSSLPVRFQLVSRQHARSIAENAQASAVARARKILHLAHEGLDMTAQVSGVLNGTITSAEGWCERLRRQGGSSAHRFNPVSSDGKRKSQSNGEDVVMEDRNTS